MWTENDEEEEASSCSGAKVSEMVVLLFLKGLSSNVMGDMLLYCYCFPVFFPSPHAPSHRHFRGLGFG